MPSQTIRQATTHFIFALWTRPDGGRERTFIGVRCLVAGTNVEVMDPETFPIESATLVVIPIGDKRLRRWLPPKGAQLKMAVSS